MPLTKWMKDMQDGDQPVELPKYVGAGDPRMRRMANAMEHDRQLGMPIQLAVLKSMEECAQGVARMRLNAEKGRLRPKVRFQDDSEFDEFTAWMNSGRR